MQHQSLFLQTVRYKARARRLSQRTERAYVGWIKRFIWYHGLRHPRDLGEAEVAAFVHHLVAERGVSASTQMQALCALLFLYGDVWGRPLGRLEGLSWGRSRVRLPVVLTRDEVAAVLRELAGVPRLVVMLLYGRGLRLMEALQVRVKDVDLGRREIRVRDTKGGRPRVTVLPQVVVEALRGHLERVERLHREDLGRGAELWDPSKSDFVAVEGQLEGVQEFATASILPTGEVLVLGGYDEHIRSSSSAWLVRPAR